MFEMAVLKTFFVAGRPPMYLGCLSVSPTKWFTKVPTDSPDCKATVDASRACRFGAGFTAHVTVAVKVELIVKVTVTSVKSIATVTLISVG
jgi:hypothetical protein